MNTKPSVTLMKTKSYIAVLAIAALGATAGSVFADDILKQYELKDGSTLVVFKDGKMAMKDKKGQTQGMKPGERMETKDGQVLMMQGNEVWRLDMETYRENRGGK